MAQEVVWAALETCGVRSASVSGCPEAHTCRRAGTVVPIGGTRLGPLPVTLNDSNAKACKELAAPRSRVRIGTPQVDDDVDIVAGIRSGDCGLQLRES
jgi:hypothetical protein